MTTLSIRLPDSVHKGVREWAEHEGISINQFVSSAVAEKLAALATETYLKERAARGSRAAFDAVLAQVPDVPDQVEETEQQSDKSREGHHRAPRLGS